MILAGDIGGTKTLLAICEVSQAGERGTAPRIEVLEQRRYHSGKFPGLGAICRAFAAELARPLPRRAGFGNRTGAASCSAIGSSVAVTKPR